MTIPILGARVLSPGEVIEDFLKRKVERNVTNNARDNAIAALIVIVDALTRKHLADHPELIEQAKAHAEAALDDGAEEKTDDANVASDFPVVAPST